MSTARSVVTWTSLLAYTATGPALPTPALRTFRPSWWSRAAFSAVKFAIAPPDTSSPPAAGGSPKVDTSQRMSERSISVAPGDSRQPPRFMFRPEASRSAATPGTVPAPVM